MNLPSINYLVVPALLSLSFSVAFAEEISVDTTLAQRGNGIVTQAAFSARANKIPSELRRAALRDTGRLRNVLNTLLLRAQIAADARASDFDQNKIVKDRMQLAADAELGEAWLQHYIKMQPEGDYERLAMEYYELNKQEIMTSEQIDVSHILISTEKRSIDEANKLADSLSGKIENDPVLFDEFIMSHSDDPSSKTNNGRFFRVKKGDMVKSFDSAAFSLKKGEISKPVQTQYGFHIIRLDEFYEPETMDFEVVKLQLMDSEQDRHQERIRQEYLGSLTTLDVQMSEAALEEMVRRQLDEGNTQTSE